MGINLKTLFILSFCASGLFAEDAYLVWERGSKALVTTEVTTDIDLKLADRPLEEAKGTEKITVNLEIAGDEPQVKALPLTLSYTLDDYQATLGSKAGTVRLGLGEKGTDFFYGELKSLKGKPVVLTMSDKAEGFKGATPNSPFAEVLDGKRARNLLLNRLREIFFLVGEPLKVGAVIEGEVTTGDKLNRKGKLVFKITELTDSDVKADLTYTVPRQEGELGDIEGTIGSAKGEARFSRKNPLDFSITMTGDFESTQKAKEGVSQQKFTLDMKMNGSPS